MSPTIAGQDVSPDHYIGGRRVASETRFETQFVLCRLASRTWQPAETHSAVGAAAEAVPNARAGF